MALAAAAWLAPAAALAAKTDVVVLLNGDRITGEVKQLAYGQLKYKTDDMGTIYIEWDKVRSLTTKQVLQVETLDGRRVYGAAPDAAADESSLTVIQARGPGKGEPLTVAMADVARIGTVEEGAWYERLDGAASFGFNYTQGTDITQSNFSGNFGTRNYKRKWDVALDWNTSSESGGPSSERASLTGTVERFLPNRYYYEGSLGFSQNDELGLDLRSMLSATFGRYLVQRSDREWRAGTGLAASREERSDGTTVESIELPLTTSFRMFRLDSPKTNGRGGDQGPPRDHPRPVLRGVPARQLRQPPAGGRRVQRLERRDLARLLVLSPPDGDQVAPAARSAASPASS